MLRITVKTNPESLTFHLEGRLAGAWVRELEHCLRESQGRSRKSVLRFDLTGVTYIDRAGKAFLGARHAEGAQFMAAGCLMKAIVDEITYAPIPAAPSPLPLSPVAGERGRGEGAAGDQGKRQAIP